MVKFLEEVNSNLMEEESPLVDGGDANDSEDSQEPPKVVQLRSRTSRWGKIP